MGTVPIGTGELRMSHSRVSWMLRPVLRSMTVSAPQRIDQTILSTSLATSDATALLPILALILTRKLRPIAIGSLSGWLMLLGMIARPRATSSRTNSGVTRSEEHTSELQSLMRISYAVLCLKKKTQSPTTIRDLIVIETVHRHR